MRKDANRLKEARFFSQKPQAQLAKEVGIHYSTLSRIECGYIEPTNTQKKKLAKALRVRVDWLFPPTLETKKGNYSNENTLPRTGR